MKSEKSPLLPRHEDERRKRAQSLEFEAQYRVDGLTVFMLVLMTLESAYSWLFYSFHHGTIVATALRVLFYLAIGSTIKLILSLMYTLCYKHFAVYALALSSFVGYLVLVIHGAILSDSLPKAPFTNLHLALPLLVSALEVYLLRRVYLGHVKYVSAVRVEEAVQITWHTMLILMKPYFWPTGWGNRARAVSTYCILGISKVANLCSPLYMATATNALTSSDIGAARAALAVYCSLVFVSTLCKELQKIVYLRVKQTAYIEIAEFTYRHLHSLSLDWHLRKKMGDVLRSMDRGVESANQVVSYMFLYLLPTMVEAIVVIFIFAMHFKVAMLAILGFIALVLYAVTTIKITLWRKKFREAMNKHDNEFHDRATDCLINFETVKCFTNEAYEVDLFSSAVRQYQNQFSMTMASLGILNSSQALIIQATIFGCLAVAVPHVVHVDHGLNIGSFVAISVYLSNLFSPLSFLGSIYNMLIKAYVDLQKLSDLLTVQPDVIDIPRAPRLNFKCDSPGVLIEFDSVSFHYPTQASTSGLRNISFRIEPNTTTAVVGQTGSGKTTLSRLLFRFYDIHQGRILVNGQNIAHVQQQSLRKAIGIVPQDTVLFNDTILSNIKYGKLDATMEEVIQVTKDAQIYDRIMSFPEQWNTKVGERGLKLSGGEKQRIAIARTLLKNPPIVILDEATSALDTVTEKQIQKALKNLRDNRTMFVIAHRLSTVRNVDQIIVLDQGQVIEQGTHDELMTNTSGAYSRLWSMQAIETDD